MPVSFKPIPAQKGNDICVKCGNKKRGHYYRRISKGGISEFTCNDCMKERFDGISKGHKNIRK